MTGTAILFQLTDEETDDVRAGEDALPGTVTLIKLVSVAGSDRIGMDPVQATRKLLSVGHLLWGIQWILRPCPPVRSYRLRHQLSLLVTESIRQCTEQRAQDMVQVLEEAFADKNVDSVFVTCEGGARGASLLRKNLRRGPIYFMTVMSDCPKHFGEKEDDSIPDRCSRCVKSKTGPSKDLEPAEKIEVMTPNGWGVQLPHDAGPVSGLYTGASL